MNSMSFSQNLTKKNKKATSTPVSPDASYNVISVTRNGVVYTGLVFTSSGKVTLTNSITKRYYIFTIGGGGGGAGGNGNVGGNGGSGGQVSTNNYNLSAGTRTYDIVIGNAGIASQTAIDTIGTYGGDTSITQQNGTISVFSQGGAGGNIGGPNVSQTGNVIGGRGSATGNTTDGPGKKGTALISTSITFNSTLFGASGAGGYFDYNGDSYSGGTTGGGGSSNSKTVRAASGSAYGAGGGGGGPSGTTLLQLGANGFKGAVYIYFQT